jgi:aerotaxis receptor
MLSQGPIETMRAQSPISTSNTEIEIPFRLDELFYSRTDKRGVISAGNSVFQRVSGIEWERLVGAPHKIVRHSDMPQSVFRVLWDWIGKGEPIGAYVKNRGKDGGFYWVYAMILPIDGGYLSVRLKPSSEGFDKIRASYAKLRARESEDGFDLDTASRRLNDIAAQHGFRHYAEFMAFTMGQEIAERDRALGREQEVQTKTLLGLTTALERAGAEQNALLRSFDALQSIPNNMRLVASRLEPSGGPVSTISENYKASSIGISDRLRSFVGGDGNLCEKMSREVANAIFLLGAAGIIDEMIAMGDQDRASIVLDWSVERELLAKVSRDCREKARAALRNGVDVAASLSRSSADIRRQMLGLDTIRVLGRVECGRMRENGGGLSAAIDQLDTFHDDIKGRLAALMGLSETISSGMTSYLRHAA